MPLQQRTGFLLEVVPPPSAIIEGLFGFGETVTMRILVSGSTGMVGENLIVALKRAGHEVLRLVRHRGQFDEVQIGWNPEKGLLIPEDKRQLENLDAVFHLGGENIAAGRWTPERKQRIHDSRSAGTAQLAELLASLENPPKTLISASAVGYYGSRGDEVLTEVSTPGQDFLARVCRDWEAACRPAAKKGTRVVNTRFGVILSPKGGALKAMLLPFRLGLAGNLGNGRQYFAWVSLPDVIQALLHVLTHKEIQGPVNVVAPQNTTNADFTTAMRQALIPGFLPMHYWTPPAPAFAIQGLLGEMGSSLLLASQRVEPIRLEETGFTFEHPTIKEALAALV
jgi:uncharacterized protein (TIGR01777 family)